MPLFRRRPAFKEKIYFNEKGEPVARLFRKNMKRSLKAVDWESGVSAWRKAGIVQNWQNPIGEHSHQIYRLKIPDTEVAGKFVDIVVKKTDTLSSSAEKEIQNLAGFLKNGVKAVRPLGYVLLPEHPESRIIETSGMLGTKQKKREGIAYAITYFERDVIPLNFALSKAEKKFARDVLLPRVASSIASMHARGVIHGDLLARNILVKKLEKGSSILFVDAEHSSFTKKIDSRTQRRELERFLTNLKIVSAELIEYGFESIYSRKDELKFYNQYFKAFNNFRKNQKA